MFNIIQWNAQGLVSHGFEFKKFLHDSPELPHILCIQESWLLATSTFRIPGYEGVYEPRPNDVGGGGVAIFVKLGISFSKIEVPHFEAIGIKIADLSIINMYVPYGFDKNRLLDICSGNTVICGDFDAHHTSWGSHKVDNKGVKITQVLEDSGFILLNNGSHTYHRKDYSSPIDLTIVAPNLFINSSWRVLQEDCGSDHYLIDINLDVPLVQTDYVPRWNFKKADWVNFWLDLSKVELDGVAHEDVEIFYTNVIHVLLDVANKNIPKSKNFFRKNPVPWWDDDCTKVVKERKKAYRRAFRTNLASDYNIYLKCKAEAQRVHRRKKKESWANYCDNLHNVDVDKMWKTIKAMSGVRYSRGISNLECDNKVYTSDDGKAEVLGKMFSAASSNNNLNPDFKFYRLLIEAIYDQKIRLAREDNSELNINFPFSIQELLKAISQTGNSSPGADQVHYNFFKHFPQSFLDIILKLFNDIWRLGVIPVDWKTATIVPILKPGKPGNIPSSYRPIALTSACCKIMEHMIVNRLVWYIDSKNIFNPYQSGFRKGRCTLDHLSRLVHTIESAKDEDGFVLGVFLDMEKAYDLLWHQGLLIKLSRIGIKGNMFKWIECFLQDRYIRVRIGSAFSQSYPLENGTPQGSVISPILFSVNMNDIPLHENIHLSVFADDVAFWARGDDCQVLVDVIQEYVDKVEDWAHRWGFRISQSKTQIIIFSKKRKLPDVKPIRINGNDVEYSDCVKFLGIHFDKKLNWNRQVDHLRVKATRANNILKCLQGYSWGAQRQLLLNVYRAIIRSKLEYSGFLYLNMSVANVKKIDSIQYQALKFITGALHGTPLIVLQNEVGEPPLYIRRVKQLIKYGLQVRNNLQHPSRSIVNGSFEGTFFTEVRKFLDEYNIQVFPRVIPSLPFWDSRRVSVDTSLTEVITKGMSPGEAKDIFYTKLFRWDRCTHIYTDGSKKDDIVGFSVCIPSMDLSFKFRIPDYLNVFTAELVAIFYAFKWCSNHKDVKDVVIFSDSLSALRALEGFKEKGRFDLLNKIHCLYNNLFAGGRDIWVSWVPAHVGVEGNERADILAKESLQFDKVNFSLQYSVEEVMPLVNKFLLERWNAIYKGIDKGGNYKEFFPDVSHKGKSQDYLRSQSISIFRLVTGFNRLNYHGFKIKGSSTRYCEVCSVFETSKHFVMECVRYDSQRDKLFRACVQNSIACTYNNIISDPRVRGDLWVFILETGRKL